MNLKERAKKLALDIPAVLLAIKHKETPWYAKFLAGIVIIYALSPIDLIPDFIPVLGILDDIILLPALIALTVKCIPENVLEQARLEAAQMQNGNEKKWLYAIPIIIFWILIILIIVKAIWV
jgi:uncharacterized membrane protein YkvA (DUF1232 family)